VLNAISTAIREDKLPNGTTQISVEYSSQFLAKSGLVFQVTVSTPFISSDADAKNIIKSKTIFALFDTGCTTTSIDTRLAEELGLPPIGNTTMITASGKTQSITYLADLSFPENTLSPFPLHKICSCVLPYVPNVDPTPTAFGLLIGRDLMSRWHITWNGTTSAVCISD
jgi:hypothetical protein